MQPYLSMAGNNAWANATLYTALSDLDAAAFAAPRPGFFGSLKATLNHIYEVDLYYLDALAEGGLGRSVYDREEVDTVAPLAARQAEQDQRLIEFCRTLTADDLTRRVTTERKGGPASERIDHLLVHLFQHQVHHRGQAHTMIAEAGIAPPQLDDFFLDYGRVPSADAFPR
ncbi:MAG: DinB family protein [Pseudomonadota bacterium]